MNTAKKQALFFSVFLTIFMLLQGVFLSNGATAAVWVKAGISALVAGVGGGYFYYLILKKYNKK